MQKRSRRPAPPQGRAWHYMVYCTVCGALPALPEPRGKALCRRHGGRLPVEAQRWAMGRRWAKDNGTLGAKCRWCTRLARPGKTTCEECGAKMAAHMRATRKTG